jgi:microcystin-dependent protein
VPTTANGGLIIPNTGDLPGTWGSNAISPDLVAIDGLFGGTTVISASNAPIVLTSPAGLTPTPGAGPTQAQNAILEFTGALTANVQVTLPLPGYYIINNQTTGAFVLSFRAIGSGQVIAVDQQDDVHIYNNGTNVRFVNLGRIGETAMWAGQTAIPAWVAACTIPPYVLCDGSVYNFSTYPSLGAKLLGQFGGNGITTFGVPDSRGRIELPYDGTGARITSAVSGINGQTIGASGGDQNTQSHTHTFAGTASGQTFAVSGNLAVVNFGSSGPGGSWINSLNNAATSAPVGTNSTFGADASQNVQPSQVTGIMVIRAG